MKPNSYSTSNKFIFNEEEKESSKMPLEMCCSFADKIILIALKIRSQECLMAENKQYYA